MTKRSKNPKKRGRKAGTFVGFKSHYCVRVYELARTGLSNTSIARALGVDRGTLKLWLKGKPELKEALVAGRSRKPGAQRWAGETFHEFVYRHLPENLQGLWDQIVAADQEDNPERKIRTLMQGQGKRTRQYLWLHALVCANFNRNEAHRKTCISRVRVDEWIEQDPDFAELINQVQEMKKDFIEGCLIGLISQGDSAATIFASKTLLRDRGYNPQVSIDVNHGGTVKHAHLSLDSILTALPIETQREVLKAVRQKASPKIITGATAGSSTVEPVEDTLSDEYEDLKPEDFEGEE